jgi:vacuolar-type H+-ATPase subunit H
MSLEQVLGFVLELEEQAQEIVNAANDRKAGLSVRVEEKLAKIREKYMNSAQKRLELIRSKEAEQLKLKLEQIHRENEAEMRKLSEAAERELDNWAESIFRNVVYTGQD